MSPKSHHSSSRSSHKASTKSKTPKTSKKQQEINGIKPTDVRDTSTEHDSNSMHSSGHEHSSTTLQFSGPEQVQSNQQGGYQYIDRPWGKYTTTTTSFTTNTSFTSASYSNISHTTNTNYTTKTTYTNTSSTIASPMERWRNTNASEQPWHGIGAVYIQVNTQNNGMDQTHQSEGDGMDSMAGERSSEELWIR